MTLRSFCGAVYRRKRPITSQTAFVQSVFSASGSAYAVSDQYGPKVFKREIPLGEDERELFPNPVDREGLFEFLKGHLTPDPGKRHDLSDRLREVAFEAGIPNSVGLVQEEFLWSLTDWFNAIIHTPDCGSSFKDHYLRRLEGQEPASQVGVSQPRHVGDRVDVSQPPALQKYRPEFWASFEHGWTLRNVGTIPWSGRTLVCVNPKDNGMRPETSVIAIPDCNPSDRNFIKASVTFTARGREGKAVSEWKMLDANGENCFPNAGTRFNVVATVTNPNATNSKGRK